MSFVESPSQQFGSPITFEEYINLSEQRLKKPTQIMAGALYLIKLVMDPDSYAPAYEVAAEVNDVIVEGKNRLLVNYHFRDLDLQPFRPRTATVRDGFWHPSPNDAISVGAYDAIEAYFYRQYKNDQIETEIQRLTRQAHGHRDHTEPIVGRSFYEL